MPRFTRSSINGRRLSRAIGVRLGPGPSTIVGIVVVVRIELIESKRRDKV